MRRIIFALLVSVLTVVVPLSAPAGAAVVIKPPPPKAVVRQARVVATPLRHALVVVASSVRLNIDELRHEWQQVAICEVDGNWSMVGPFYSGIGFLNSTWSEYGGRQFAPLAGEASRDQQILVGMRVTGGWVPDQGGCSQSGW
ncbi:MAG: transglycosylase family protein [Acidimicrobiales bacterium]